VSGGEDTVINRAVVRTHSIFAAFRFSLSPDNTSQAPFTFSALPIAADRGDGLYNGSIIAIGVLQEGCNECTVSENPGVFGNSCKHLSVLQNPLPELR
jgi:hypothetical protein